MMSVEGYHEYTGECSVLQRDTISTPRAHSDEFGGGLS